MGPSRRHSACCHHRAGCRLLFKLQVLSKFYTSRASESVLPWQTYGARLLALGSIVAIPLCLCTKTLGASLSLPDGNSRV